MADEWWRQLGEYVERHIGRIEGTTTTIVGDLPQILHVRPSANPKALVLVSQGATEGKYPREFCVAIAAENSGDEAFVQGLLFNLRMFADYARGASKPFRLGDTIAFADPPEPLWDGSMYSGFCLAQGAVDGSEGDFHVEGIGFIPLLVATPVFAAEMSKPSLQAAGALSDAIVAKGYQVSRPSRPSLTQWRLW